MKIRFFFILAFLLGFQQLFAQSLSQAQLNYNEFVKHFSASGECDAAYGALYSSYKEYMAVLDSARPGSNEYEQSKARLKKMMPYIYSGAYFYTQKGNAGNTNAFVEAYVSVCVHNAFRNEEIEKGDNYATFAWMAATNAYNAKRYEDATRYLTSYINSGDATRRNDAFYYLAKAYINSGDNKNAKYILEQGLMYSPNDEPLLVAIINMLGESKEDDAALQRYVKRALVLRPSDEGLLNIQAQLYERIGDYENAIVFYDKLEQLKPQNLEIARRLAICNYNAGVVCAGDADNLEQMSDKKGRKEAKVKREQANVYFERASEVLNQVLYNDPLAFNYAIALAKAYAYLGNAQKLSEINARIIDLGYQPITMGGDMAVVEYNQMSPSMNVEYRQVAQQPKAEEEKPVVAQENKKEEESEKSDVDIDIPVNATVNDRVFVYIIANEDYTHVADVPNAANDGKVFAEYCNKVLGIPKDNIMLHQNVSYGALITVVDDIRNVAEALNGDCNLIVYYAGHGIPDESEKSAYLLPVDSDGKHVRTCYSLSELYSELGSLNAKCTTVFLDACFSGASRNNNGEMVVSARSIAIDVDESEIDGRLVVFSAASDDQTALAYDEKKHGLFTYFLLKKLKESNGDVSLLELGDYLKEQVALHSVLKNRKKQTPSVVVGSGFGNEWELIRLKE